MHVAGGNSFNHNKPDPKHLTDTIEIIGGNLKKAIIESNKAEKLLSNRNNITLFLKSEILKKSR